MVDVQRDRFATPFERAVARRLRRAAGDERSSTLEGLTATVEIASNDDPQRATVRFERGAVTVSRDDPAPADARLTTDGIALCEFDVPEDDELASTVASLLEAPDLDWREAAEAFWASAGSRPGLPRPVGVRCLDGGELRLGGDDEPEYEIVGTADALVELFDGRRPLLELLYTQRLFFRGSLRHFSVLQGVSMDVMLDD